MEKKIFLKANDKPITFGSLIVLRNEVKTPYGKAKSSTVFTLTPSNLDTLIKNGIVYVKEDKKVNPAPTDMFAYIASLADKEGWPYNKMLSYVDKLNDIYPAAAFSLLLKTIAKRLDKKYDDHISKSKEIWIVSIFDGKACPVDKKSIVSYNHFAAFRTKEDAEFAIEVLKPLILKMFGK